MSGDGLYRGFDTVASTGVALRPENLCAKPAAPSVMRLPCLSNKRRTHESSRAYCHRGTADSQ
jgi:hypothetical protein